MLDNGASGPHGPLANVLEVRRGPGDPHTGGLEHREALIYTLGKAAELEHLVMLQYLFAAVSLKQKVEEGLTPEALAAVGRWRATLLEISAQEMLHLALVQNLLTAVGAAPRLARPNFPMSAYAYPAGVRIELMPFGEAALRHFAFLERPEGMDVEDAEGFEAIAQAVPLPHDEQDEIVPHLQEFDTIGQLYRSIEAGFDVPRRAARLGAPLHRPPGCPGDRAALPLAGARRRDRPRVRAARHRHDRRTGRRGPRRVARCPLRAPAWVSSRTTSSSRRPIRPSSPPGRSWRPTSGRKPRASSCP